MDNILRIVSRLDITIGRIFTRDSIMRRLPVLLGLALMMLSPASAFAHAVGMTCTNRGAKIEVEAYFDDDSPAIRATVQVVDAQEKTVANGQTDSDGKWSFKTPAPGTYEVRLDAGAGHRAKKVLVVAPPVEKTAEPAAEQIVVEEGKTRAEFTGVPWLKVMTGLIVIAGLGGAYILASALRAANRASIAP
jgi:hypothetical protein